MAPVAIITTAWQYAYEDGRIHFTVSDGEHERCCVADPGSDLHALLLPHVTVAALPPQESLASQVSMGQ